MQATVEKDIVVISFQTDEDMDKGFDELIYNSNSKISAVDERQIAITQEQLKLLKNKNIGYSLVK